MDQTAKNFEVKQVSADKGITATITMPPSRPSAPGAVHPLQEHVQAGLQSQLRKVDPDTLWNKMYHLFHYKREEFMPHYHKRSNVESDIHGHQGKIWRCDAEPHPGG